MRQSKTEFFKNGVNDQKTPDIVISLRRPDMSKINKWTMEEKQHALRFLDDAQKQANAFFKELYNNIG
jgi:hypothetical protein